MNDMILMWMEGLQSKDNTAGYQALKRLEAESEESNQVYQFFDQFVDMLENRNSFIRTRGLVLIAANAKWDTENKIDEVIDQYCRHIEDEKPITARQCIQALPQIVKYKKELAQVIIDALTNANLSIYQDSMRPLIAKDRSKALQEIRNIL